MKFPRNARIFRGQLDFAPFAIIFFLLALFIMMSTLVYTPGVRVNLPVGDNLPGTDRRPIAVAIAKGGQMYYRSQLVDAKELRFKLAEEAKRFAEPPTLVVMMDKDVTGQMLMNLSLLARDAGITELSWAAMPSDPLVPSSRTGP